MRRVKGVLCMAALVAAAGAPPAGGAVVAPVAAESKKIVTEGSITAYGPTALTLLSATADGAIPYELSWHFEGDLTGDVTTAGTITIDPAAGTMTERATEKFVGKIKGVGKGTLTWKSTWTAANGTMTRDYAVKVTRGTGKLKKLRGDGEESLRIQGGEFVFPGTYTFTLKKRSG